jgi:hypothetical protein
MGLIFKLLLFFIVISWVFSKLLGFFVKSKLKQFVDHSQDLQREEQRRKAKPKSGVNVDYVPEDFQKKKSKEIRGGDYVDYEEVKE